MDQAQLFQEHLIKQLRQRMGIRNPFLVFTLVTIFKFDSRTRVALHHKLTIRVQLWLGTFFAVAILALDEVNGVRGVAVVIEHVPSDV